MASAACERALNEQSPAGRPRRHVAWHERLRRAAQGFEQPRKFPVLLLTARGEDVDRIVGLEIGADDYLPKPFNPRELVARIRAILRRTHGKRRGRRSSGVVAGRGCRTRSGHPYRSPEAEAGRADFGRVQSA